MSATSIFRLGALLGPVMFIGCDASNAERDLAAPPDVRRIDAALIERESRSHHFGVVLSKSRSTLSHAYGLYNPVNHDIRVTQLVNRRPCCGQVRIGKTVLHPGDATDVDVELSINREFGPVAHETEIKTEPPQSEKLVLLTTATVHPAVRFEEMTPATGTVLLCSEKPKVIQFLVKAYGTAADPAVDRDRVVVQSSIGAEWLARKEEHDSEGGLTVEARRMSATLDPRGEPGERTSSITLLDDNGPLVSHSVTWEAMAPITASPKAIVLKSDTARFRVRIDSRDQKTFSVTGVESSVPGLSGTAAGGTAALTQVIELERRGRAAPEARSGRGVISVFTDHPGQRRVDLSVISID